MIYAPSRIQKTLVTSNHASIYKYTPGLRKPITLDFVVYWSDAWGSFFDVFSANELLRGQVMSWHYSMLTGDILGAKDGK